MALTFGKSQGKAAKSVDAFEIKDGDNTVRIVGDILPRYIYWIKNSEGKNVAVECLAFDREKEKFTDNSLDKVPNYYPDLKCSWAYSIQVIEAPGTPDAKIKTFNLKKKLFQQIKTLAEDLGDPTDLDNGWDIMFKKVKTGSKAYDVEYTLQQMRCKKRPLSDAERTLVAEMKHIDQIYPRPTIEAVEKQLKSLSSGSTNAEELPEEAASELG